ncbi:MAG: hypothetical protein C4541_04940, partial [Candidatus Auribacter fodinae]
MFILGLSCSAYADVPNAPAFTGFGGKTVVVGETIYTNNNQQGVAQPAVLIQGSAQAGTTITVYRDGTLVSPTVPAQIIVGADGQWSATATMATGDFNITATASNADGESLHSEPVHVVLDTTAPTVTVYVVKIGSRTNMLYMFLVDNIYGRITDSASGVDWSTASISLRDTTLNQNIAGTQAHDSTLQINYYPTPNWDVIYREAHEFRITVTASDKAGNSSSNYRDYIYDHTAPSKPVITHIYDQGTWKPYSSGMTINTNPPKIRGYVQPVNKFNEGPNAYAVFDERFHLNQRTYWRADDGKISIPGGNFDYEFQPGEIFQEGTDTFRMYACDSSYLSASTSITLNFAYGTPAQPPMPTSPNFSTLYPTISNDRQVIGDPTVPDISGTIPAKTYIQTVRIFDASQYGHTWTGVRYNYSIDVLPAGQQYPNTSGYDRGEVYIDANDNNQYDAGEDFLNKSSKGVSDGQSYSIPNFSGYVYRENNNCWIKIAVVNQYGSSESRILGRFHCRTTPPTLQSITITPQQSPYLSVSQKPTQIKVNTQISGYDWRPEFYGVNESISRLQILENDVVIATKTTTWTDLQSLRYEGVFNVSDVTFQPQKMYKAKVRVRDLMTNQTVEDMYTFFIDTLAPQVVDIIPEPGS